MTYVWPDRLPPKPVEIHRYWRDGRIISGSTLPPGSYHVMLKKFQVDAFSRHQYHWELISYDKLDFSSSHRLQRRR